MCHSSALCLQHKSVLSTKMSNVADSLRLCWMKVGDPRTYIDHGPGFIFLYHPALGPLWDVIAQKVQGGSLSHGSELVLEVCLPKLRVYYNHVHNLLLGLALGAVITCKSPLCSNRVKHVLDQQGYCFPTS